MKFKKLLMAAALSMTAVGASAATTTLDFASDGDCSGGTGVSFSTIDMLGDASTDPSITTTCGSGAGSIAVGTGVVGNTGILNPVSSMSGVFDNAASSVSVTMAAFGPGVSFLNAFDASDALIGSASQSATSLDVLSVSASNIAYVVFGNEWALPNGGFSIVDSFSYEVAAVPVPAAGFLLIGALGGLGFVSRHRKKAA